MDINAQVPDAQPCHLELQNHIARRQIFPHAFVVHFHIHTTRTTQVKMPPLLGIEIDQRLAMQSTGRQFTRAVHAGFFIDG